MRSGFFHNCSLLSRLGERGKVVVESVSLKNYN